MPNSKSTRISDEFVHNYPIKGVNNNLNDRLTPFQLSTYNVSKHRPDNTPTDDTRPFSFSQSEYTVNKSEGGINMNDPNLGEWVVPNYSNSNRNPNTQMSVKGYDKRGVHTHRLNKFNFVSTINPKSIDSFKITYGFLKTRILGISKDDYLGKVKPVWDISQGRPLGNGDQNRTDGNSIIGLTIDPATGNFDTAAAPIANRGQYVPDPVKQGGTRGRRVGVVDDPPFKPWIGWGEGDRRGRHGT